MPPFSHLRCSLSLSHPRHFSLLRYYVEFLNGVFITKEVNWRFDGLENSNPGMVLTESI